VHPLHPDPHLQLSIIHKTVRVVVKRLNIRQLLMMPMGTVGDSLLMSKVK
jgi:hypothetical protein